MSIRFNINEDAGKVVAYFAGSKDYWMYCITTDVTALTANNRHINISIEEAALIAYKVVEEGGKLIGESKVNVADGDKFDANVGMEIARARLLDKYDHIKLRAISIALGSVNHSIDQFTGKIEKAIAKLK